MKAGVPGKTSPPVSIGSAAFGDDARAAWLGFVVGRTFEASLNMAGDRHIALQDRLGCQIGIDMAQWWRPTAANYFDRVSKQVILDALADVGGPELSARFASVKKTLTWR
jgi:ParB family chromosome partitioning protein